MLGDLLESLFEDAEFGVGGKASRRAQMVARLAFGLLGTGLAAVGLVEFGGAAKTSNLALQASFLALFASLGCFCLFNVALGRRWRWPGLGILLSLAAAFVTRIAFGV